MNLICYLWATLWLFFSARRTAFAKRRMKSATQNSHDVTSRWDKEYMRFLIMSSLQEKMVVLCKRYSRRGTDYPILKVNLNLGIICVSPRAIMALTGLDMELGLTRHKYGDWGIVPSTAWYDNNKAVKSGEGRLLSRYRYNDFEDAFLIETDLKTHKTDIRLRGETDATHNKPAGIDSQSGNGRK